MLAWLRYLLTDVGQGFCPNPLHGEHLFVTRRLDQIHRVQPRLGEPDAPDLPEHVHALILHDHARIEPGLEAMLAVLGREGAREIWHKHGTFYDHLLGVWRILAAWRQPPEVCRLGLMHSVYSNSFVRMKVFDAEHAAGREAVRRLIGDEAERLVHLFCTIRREELLLLLGDAEVPVDGIEVGSLLGDRKVRLSRRDLGIFLVVTMADYAEQFFGWQDRLFALPGRDGTRGGGPHALWPGDNRPGLWMDLSARLGLRAAACGIAPRPPVFEGCTAQLARAAEAEARDLYWEVVSDISLQEAPEEAGRALGEAIRLNPFLAEPHVLLAQLHLNARRFDEALAESRRALDLLATWATPWDKRLSWEAWIAWTRVLAKGARERDWPDTAYGVISLGEVRPGH